MTIWEMFENSLTALREGATWIDTTVLECQVLEMFKLNIY